MAYSKNGRKNGQQRPRGNRVSRSRNAINQVVAAFTSLVSEPVAFGVLIIALVLALTHIADPAKGVPAKLAAALSAREKVKEVGDWLAGRLPSFVGFCIYAVPISAVNGDRRVVLLAAAALVAFFLPEADIWEYAVQAAALRIFLKVPRPAVRIIMVIVCVGAYFGGYATSNFTL